MHSAARSVQLPPARPIRTQPGNRLNHCRLKPWLYVATPLQDPSIFGSGVGSHSPGILDAAADYTLRVGKVVIHSGAGAPDKHSCSRPGLVDDVLAEPRRSSWGRFASSWRLLDHYGRLMASASDQRAQPDSQPVAANRWVRQLEVLGHIDHRQGGMKPSTEAQCRLGQPAARRGSAQPGRHRTGLDTIADTQRWRHA